MNKLNAIGVLIKTGRSKFGYAGITLLIKRPREDDAYVDFVLDTTLDPSLVTGSVVEVEGYLRGYSSRDVSGKWLVTQYLVATKVTLAKSVLEQEFGTKGHFPPASRFSIFVEGNVSMVVQTGDNWKKLGLRIQGNREVAEAATLDMPRNRRTLSEFNSIERGDTIQAHLNVKTPTKIINGTKETYLDIIVEDLVITNRTVEQIVEPAVPKSHNNSQERAPRSLGGKSKRRRGKRGNVNASDTRPVETVTVEGTIPQTTDDSASTENNE